MLHKYSKNMIVWVVVISTLFVMLFSTICMIEDIDHICTGEDCPICATMIQCSENLKTIGTAAVTVATIIFLFAAVKEILSKYAGSVSCNSLISRKIRLNN